MSGPGRRRSSRGVVSSDGAVTPRIRSLTLDAGSTELSALICAPERRAPRATIVALHGVGMRAQYFGPNTVAGNSLLELGEKLGFAVVAVDRPGYGRSAHDFPAGLPPRDQVHTLAAAFDDLRSRIDVGAGLFLHAHSFGGAVALMAADDRQALDLMGVDVAGCGHRGTGSIESLRAASRTQNWMPYEVYPQGTLRAARNMVARTPACDLQALSTWADAFAGVARHVQVPVRLTFAEHEQWWMHDEETLTDLRSQFSSSPHVVVDHQPDAAHNTSLCTTAREFHLRALGFAAQCLERR